MLTVSSSLLNDVKGCFKLLLRNSINIHSTISIVLAGVESLLNPFEHPMHSTSFNETPTMHGRIWNEMLKPFEQDSATNNI